MKNSLTLSSSLALTSVLIGIAHADDLNANIHRWWFPDGAPVSGQFATAANWAGFSPPPTTLPSLSCLAFQFAAPADMTANNNLQSGLQVVELLVNNPDATTRITGLPLRFKPNPGSPFPDVGRIGVPPGSRLVLEAPLQGTTGVLINGTGRVNLAPSPTSQHTISGGIRIRGVLEAGSGPALGNLNNNSVIMEGGAFVMTSPFSIAIPVVVVLGGSIHTETVGNHTITLPLEGSGNLSKRGHGALILEGTDTSASVNWVAAEGELIAARNALGGGDMTIWGGARVTLTGDNKIGKLDNTNGNTGILDIATHTLTIRSSNSGFTDSVDLMIEGTGTIVIDNGAEVRIEEQASFTGTYDVRDGTLIPVFGSSFASGTDLNIGASGLVACEQQVALNLGKLSGSGPIVLELSNTLRIGQGDASSVYTGAIRYTRGQVPDAPRIEKVGTGEITVGEIGPILTNVLGGTLTLGDSGFSPSARFFVSSGATLVTSNPADIRRLSGSGTLSVVGRLDLASGGEDITFNGSVIGTESASIRKQGAGTLRLNGDLSGFRGAFDVMGGVARFSGQPIFPNALVMGVNGLSELRGYGTISTLVANVGVIASDVGGRTMTITGAGKQNLDGVFEAVNGGVLAFDSAVVDQLDQSPGNLSVIRAQNASEMRFVGGASTVNDGRVEADGDGVVRISAPGTAFNGVAFRGNLTIDSGSLVLDGAVLNIDAGVSAGNDRLVVTFSGEPDPAPLISGNGQVNLLGTVEVVLPDGYVATPGDRVRVAELPFDGSPSVVAEPDAMVLPDIGALPWRAVTTPGSLEYIIACSSADVASPFGALDIDDVLTFLDGFANGDAAADLVADGVFDIDDVLFFLDAFAAGCP